MIESHHDHRISMSFAVASLRCEHAIEINGVDNVKTSFPNFVELANSIGMNIVEIFLRDEYINNNANQPNERNMVKGLKGDWEGKLTTKELYTLFPKGPAKQAGKIAGLLQGGTFQQPKGMIESHHDHRISMSFAVASLLLNKQGKLQGYLRLSAKAATNI
jgi:hypothetical protein